MTKAQEAWLNLSVYRRHEVLSVLGDPNRATTAQLAAADVLIDFCHEGEKVDFRKWQERERLPPCDDRPDGKYSCEFPLGHEGMHGTHRGKRWDDDDQQERLD